MTLKAIVEKIDDEHYRAAIAAPFALESEGATEDEAIARLRELVLARQRSCKVVDLGIPDGPNPWMKLAGLFKDDPEFEEWQKIIKENRREMDLVEFP